MEVEYILYSYTVIFSSLEVVRFLFIYVNNTELFFSSEAVGLVLKDPDLNYVFTTCYVTMNLIFLKFIFFMYKVVIVLTSKCLYED